MKNPFKKAIAVERDNLRKSNRNFQKDRVVRLPLKEEDMKEIEGEKRIAAFRSFHFFCQLFETGTGVMRLAVNRAEIDRAGQWIDGITYDDLVWIKTQCGFGDCDAVEIFPKDEHYVDVPKVRHLFIFPPSVDYPLAWRRVKMEQLNEQSNSPEPAATEAGDSDQRSEPPERHDPDQQAGAAGGDGQSGEASKIVPLR